MARRAALVAGLVVVLALAVAGIAWSRSHPSGPAGRTVNQTNVPSPTAVSLGPTDCRPWACDPRRQLPAAAAPAPVPPVGADR